MRNNKLDLLRFIGLAMIILAHVEPPRLILNLRNFDVPLMVVLSGIAFGLSYKDEPYFKYVWKRVKRLVFPVWIFLTVYFSLLYIAKPSTGSLSYEAVYSSYFLISGSGIVYDGIGYVWIIRVFLLVALVAPFLYSYHKNTESNTVYLTFLLVAYTTYEICRYLFTPYIPSSLKDFFYLIVFYLVPYALLFAFGLRLPQISTKTKYRLLYFFSACLIGFTIVYSYQVGFFFPIQNFKYPPLPYYLCYGITVSIFLLITGDAIWQTLEKITIVKKTILFVARNSLWIYLLHIPIVRFVETNFIVKYAIAFSISVCFMLFQAYFVNQILVTKISHTWLKKNLKMMLTG